MNKRSGRRAALRGKQVALAVAAAFMPWGEAYSLPTGEVVVNGQVTVSRPDSQRMQIDQASQKGIVNWQGFSIGAAEHVNVNQLNASSVLLNRVVGNSPSEIFGRLTANGQIFLVNNAGVLFAPGASVDVGSLMASSLSITDQNFLNGTYQFYNPGNAGSVVNAGSIITPGGFTALIGPQVRNDGVIIANSGKVALGAGDRVSLSMFNDNLVSISVDEAAFNASIVNTGTLQADNGTVMLKASSMNALLDTVINTSGVIRASGLSEQNGEIVLDGGSAGTVQVAGLVQAESGRIAISAGGALNVGSTVCCFPTTIIAATEDISAGSITVGGGAQIVGNTGAGTQTITTPGTLLVRGGIVSGSVGIFHNGSGEQSITAGEIQVRGGSGNGTSALIASQGPGNQVIDTSRIEITGGSVGSNNPAMIRANVADQTVNVGGDIVIAAGVRGEALLQGSANGLQRVFAHNIGISNAVGGTDSFGAIRAGHQEIHASGNVLLTGGATGGTVGGVRIGGLSGAASDVRLFVDGDLVLTGGSAPNNSANIGSSGTAAVPNTIYIDTGGKVVLNPGSADWARIGSGSALGGGSIEIHADGGIEMNGISQSTVIRTLGNVTLDAASISQASNGSILANSLTTSTSGNTLLTGPNQVSSFNASATGGDVVLNNAGALTVTGLSALNAALTNQGDVTVSGPWNSFGTAITTTGAGSDLTVNNIVTSNGALNVNVAGDIAVTAGGTQDAMLTSFGGQNINARSLAVTSNDGRFAAVRNTGPSAQAINLSGGAGLDVQTLSPGGFAQVSADAGGSQTVNVVNGDHINVNGASGAAMISNFGGAQTLSITGSGANVITLGAPGSLGPSQVFGGVQNITAGAGGESGSITIVGGNANATFTGISSGQILGGTQTVSTSGALRIAGGNAPNQPPSGFSTGLFHNGSGQQTVNAASLEMQGGSSGVNNLAIIISSGGALTITPGDQVVNVAGNVGLAGGAGGTNNTAIIVSLADQAVNAGSVGLEGGAGGVNNGAIVNIANPGGNQLLNIAGDLSIAGGAGGNAGITGSPTFQQTIFANDISLTNAAAGGNNSVGFILGGHQDIHATGDVTLTARASGGALPGVRIGGLAGAAPTATDLMLTLGGNLLLSGGTAVNNGVGIGSTAAAGPALANTIAINAGGSVILNSGTAAATGARIGSPAIATGPGNISISAGGGIELNGSVQGSTAIRTLGNVALNAASISEASNGFVIANSLATNTSGNTALAGPNQISNFSGSAGGDLALNNTGALAVSSLSAANATLTNNGNVTLSGPWNSSGATSISVASDLAVTNNVQSNGPMTLDVDGAVRVVGSGVQDASLTAFGGQSITAQSLEVTSLDGRFASVGNNVSGDQTIAVSGGGVVTDSVSGNGFAFITNGGTGAQLITASDGSGVQVRNSSGSGSGQINNFGAGNQTISVSGGGGVDVRTLSGTGFSMISNSGGGHQTVAVTGGTGIDVVSGGGFATISQSALGMSQVLTATNADHINLNGLGGNAIVSVNAGPQTVSITGSGANAITVGSARALGFSQFANSSTQSVTAGLPGQQGSITIVGPAVNNTAASIVSRPGAGGTQTVATSGLLSITGGTAPNQAFGSGVFHNGTGLQKITASNVVLQGGLAGSGNGVFINSSGGGNPANAGDQEINVAGGVISVTGGAGGDNNRALIISSGNQTINGDPDLIVEGGASSGAAGNNLANVLVTGPAKTQTIHARNITVASGAGGVNNSAGISGTKQVINTAGDLVMTGGASTGLFSGTRIGGLGGTTVGPTDLTMNIGGDLRMTGGTAEFNGASIGSTLSTPALPNLISINVAGDVVMTSGTAAGTRIGTSVLSDTLAGGTISIAAGGRIELNGNSAAAPTVIRTLGNVTLSAGGAITEGDFGRIEANTLSTTSGGATSLTGPNQVSSFTASSDTGNVSLRNTAPLLTLGSMELPGSLSIVQAGALSIPVTVSALAHTIDVTGDVLVGSAGATGAALLYATDGISIATPGSVIVRGSDVTPLAASAVLAGGGLNVSAGNVSLIGGAALATPAVARGEVVAMTIGGELNVTGGSGHLSPALLSSGSNIDLTVGNAVRLDAGSGLLSVARVQTEIKDGVIHISFPNLAEGGYFVNGIEGRTHHGQTGFFTLHKPAKVGKTLLLEYGN